MKLGSMLILGVLVATSLTIFGLSIANGGSAFSKDAVVLSKSNTVVLSGEIDGSTAAQVISQTRALSGKKFAGSKPIYLFMNTPGGSVQAGLEIIEALKGLSRPIETVTLFSASMGFQLVQNLGERLILRNGVLMSHRAAGSFEGYFGGQRPSQIDNRYNFWLSRLKELDEQTVRRTNGKQTLASYQKSYADELWLTGEQSLEGGYADKIVTVSCDSSLDGTTSHTIEFLGLQITYEMDNCPINTSPMNPRIANPDSNKEPLYPERAKEVMTKFMEQFANKQKAVVPMYW